MSLDTLRQLPFLGWLPRGRHLVIAIPYLWMLLFFLIPFIIILKISFAEVQIAIPPYTDLVSYAEEKLNFVFNLGNYLYLLDDEMYLDSYLQSIQVASISTLLCLLIGYPMAWAIVHSSPAVRNALLMLVVLPSWTSFLIRVYAWIGILKNNGLINNLLMWLGIIDEPLTLLHTNAAVYVGIVYAYLPFMILPIYTALMRMDYSLVEAASDLGARPYRTFLSITLPLTKSGIIAGSMLVFIPAVGEFVIPELLGGPDSLLIGRVLWQEFFNNRDWPVASAVAVVMLMILMAPIIWFYRYQRREMQESAS
ncbi:putrescine ABC transporter permease PotH [uncultured Tolumonas sp.]|uniref:putrescine ABC transporter permease PotH n=1 Tax=uncultured Tolumonas sp. TaxID=263765 RepID=UPI002A0A4237|nr:putrescine ABC transporter permease PotH [uncultured Tolumonas sp.]